MASIRLPNVGRLTYSMAYTFAARRHEHKGGVDVSREIVLENSSMILTLEPDGTARSLIAKATGEECLMAGARMPMFSVTQERPYNNEVKLAHPNKRTTFPADRVRLEDGNLIVGFKLAPYEAVISVHMGERFIGFKLEDFIVSDDGYPDLCMAVPPVAELRLAQLPVRRRERFGEWLNVMWDDDTAVALIAASPRARIDADNTGASCVMTADAVRGIRLRGTEAALIVTDTPALMDAIAEVEETYDLPRGVASRRGDMINASAYWSGNITPENVDEHIRYARMGGFRLMLIYYTSLFKTHYGYDTCGDYDYRPEYGRGIEDVRAMLSRIRAAGITPGLHFLHTHIGIRSRYVTPRADHRLNKTRTFTLARPLGAEDDEVWVEQDTYGMVMSERCRILQFGTELISYEGCSDEPPYRFTGCKRGVYGTVAEEHPMGLQGGLVDVSEFGHGHSFYLDQNSSLQDEIADKLAQAYGAGFEFAYFDGSEGTNAPFEYHVPNAQYRVFRKLKPAPLFAEGAAKAHFSWHMLSGGNAFDIFPPSVFKQKIAQFPMEEAPRMRSDLTRLNFGWWAFWAPGDIEGEPTGTQPDMYEYGTSRAAAWDCPATMMENVDAFHRNPRTDDIFEVMRRWEDVRKRGWLTEEQKQELRAPDREHILLIDEQGEYELAEYRHVSDAAGGDMRLRAFVFERRGARYAVYWHATGQGRLMLSLKVGQLSVMDKLGADAAPACAEDGSAILPLDSRRYIKTDASMEELVSALRSAKVCED